jgi:hypothetical protein
MVFVLFTISRSLNLKSATDPISIENRAGHRFQRVEIGSVADFGDGNRKSKWAFRRATDFSFDTNTKLRRPSDFVIKYHYHNFNK